MKQMGYFFKKTTALLIALVMCISAVCAVPAVAEEKEGNADKTAEVVEQTTASKDAIAYKDYIANCKDATVGKDKIVISAASYTDGSKSAVEQIYNDYEGNKGTSVTFKDEGTVTFKFKVEKAGLYTLKLNYFTGSASGSSIVRDILIDGKAPYSESNEVSFPQLWIDESDERTYDKLDNEIRTQQVQIGKWRSEYAVDVSGLVSGALQYYLSAGEHTVSLVPERETLHLKSIVFEGAEYVPTYEEALKTYKEKGYKNASPEANVTVQAEDAFALKSDQTMYGLNDRTSPSVTPYDVNLVRYNTIGGTHWQIVGQWVEWEIDVKETGLYNIVTHFKQSTKTNDVSIREVYIDGKLPFKEADAIRFYYDSAWQSECIGDKDGNPYLFYMEKGKHVIRLRVGLGDSTDFIFDAKGHLEEFNYIYRRIVMITGVSPDTYRDYQLEKAMPDVIEQMKALEGKMEKLIKDVGVYNGQSGASTVTLNRLYDQLVLLNEDPETIPANLSTFQSNVASFGTWINERTAQPLELDSVMIKSPDTETPKGEAGFFKMMWHYIMQFFYSFVTDYDSVGVMEETAPEEITVWIPTGRDQAQILKQMINDDFTPNHNIAANVQLITAAALLPSIFAGSAPDIYSGSLQADPINLSLRDAVVDLSEFPDFKDVIGRYTKEATVPFQRDGATYALPDTMDYYIMFVRTDIMEELGLSLDQLNDWDTILSEVLPVLQLNSLAFGIPVGIHSYLMYLYQSGGTMYNPDGKTSALSDAKAIAAMQKFTDLYTQYGFNLAYDFANRFRSGEIPVAVANLSSYNQLSVFAPDINGLWTMLPIPGTYNAEGKLDRSCASTVTASIMLNQKDTNKEAAWEYLKWWSSEEVQLEYGSELEGVMGSAARYNPANSKAFERIAWDKDMKESLLRQRDWVKAYVEVPGGYLTTRYYDFAFRYVVYDSENVRDTLTENVESINREIAHKRAEYNLD